MVATFGDKNMQQLFTSQNHPDNLGDDSRRRDGVIDRSHAIASHSTFVVNKDVQG